MRTLVTLLFLCTLTNLAGCSSMRGNVVPQTGPSMEQVYDSMGINKPRANAPMEINPQQPLADNQKHSGEADLTEIRQNVNTTNKWVDKKANMRVGADGFRKLPNPELTLYVYPHLAGNAEVPIPGYFTVFNAYERDHYALPQETPRD